MVKKKYRKKGFNVALALQQAGAEPVRVGKKTLYKVGNALYPKKAVVAARKEYGKAVLGIKKGLDW